jgi:WD40 repeat protein
MKPRALALALALLAASAALPCAAQQAKLALREAVRFEAADGVPIMRAQFSPSGDRLLTASGGGEAALWTLDGKPEAHFAGQRPPMFAANFSPDAREIATTGYDGTIRLWTLGTGHFRVLKVILSAVTDVAYCGRDRRIVFSSDAGIGRLLRLTPKPVRMEEVRGSGTARRVACSPQRRLFATAFDSGEVQVKGFGHGRVTRFQTAQKRLNAVAFSPDGGKLLTASTDGTVKLWTTGGKPLVAVTAAQDGWANDARFSPDGKLLAVATDDGHVRLYDLAGALLLEYRVTKARATTVAFAPDGSKLAAGSSAGELALYEVTR